jgi:hypothetical protein
MMLKHPRLAASALLSLGFFAFASGSSITSRTNAGLFPPASVLGLPLPATWNPIARKSGTGRIQFTAKIRVKQLHAVAFRILRPADVTFTGVASVICAIPDDDALGTSYGLFSGLDGTSPAARRLKIPMGCLLDPPPTVLVDVQTKTADRVTLDLLVR